MPPINILIKPASSNCNLRCKYCFYHSISEKRQIKSYGVMNTELQELLIKKALEYADHICTFAFQGGEPTLAGLDYFKRFVALVEANNVKKVQVNFALQTNGVMIDAVWAKFLADNKFLVGLSLDGPKDLNDAARVDAQNKGSFGKVIDTIRILNKYGVECNILCVVNSYNARHVNKVYSFFKKIGFKYMQFIPCLDPLGKKPGGFEYSLSPERYTYFLKNLFDIWYRDVSNGDKISIRYFDNLVGMMAGYPPESCGMSGVCMNNFVLEADGSVYPCDFYVIDEWCLGNIKEKDFAELKTAYNAEKFINASKYINSECRECKWFGLCRGGCRRYREPFENGNPNLNYYCKSFREFFEYAQERMEVLARRI